MAHTLRESLASSCCSQRLFLVGLLIVLICPALTTAEVIFEDDFEGLLNPRWFSDWGMWASQGYDGTNDPAPPPVRTPEEPGSSLVGCNVDNPFDVCGPGDPPTLAAGNMPVPRPLDTPGKITTGVVGWMTLRKDPVNFLDPPGCDPDLGECGPCDPSFQECFERHDGTLRMDGIDISNVTMDTTVNPNSGVDMGLVARFQGAGGSSSVVQAFHANYTNAFGRPTQIFFTERLFSTHSENISTMFLPNDLESPIHMELTVEGGEVNALVTFTVGDADEEYTISMVNETHEHVNIPGLEFLPPHFRPMPEPGRWGFINATAENSGTDYITWDNFCFTDPGETCGVQTQPGDHDGDGDVDGNDFLGSQLLGASAVSNWKGNYPIPAPLSGVAVVPEPSTLSFCALGLAALGLLGQRSVARAAKLDACPCAVRRQRLRQPPPNGQPVC